MVEVQKVCGKNIDLVLSEVTNADPKNNIIGAFKYDIVLKDGIVIGDIYARFPNKRQQRYNGDIGFGIMPKYRGNGYAVEAVNLIKDVYIKNGKNKIIIANANNNLASIRVCEKVGANKIKELSLPATHPLKVNKGIEVIYIWELNL